MKWAVSHKNVPNDMSPCHTKGRMGVRAHGCPHPSFGMIHALKKLTPPPKKKKLKSVSNQKISVQGTVDLWSYIFPIDKYSHTL